MNDLVAIQSVVPSNVFVAGGGDPIIDAIKREVMAIDRDISTDEGRDTVRKLAYKVARSKTFIDEAGKKFVEDKKKEIKVVDSERSRIWDALEALQKEVRGPLTEFEEAEKNRIAGHETALLELEQATIFDGFVPSPAQVQQRIDAIQPYSDSNWEEFAKRAGEANGRVSANLSKLLAERTKYDADQAELEKLRREQAERDRIEREGHIRAEAAEKARLEAEAKAKLAADEVDRKARAEKEEIERLHRASEERAVRAEQEKIDSEVKAKAEADQLIRKAELDRQQAEERALREKEDAVRRERDRAEAEKLAEQAAAAKREADTKHRANINNAALKAFTDLGVPVEHAKTAIEAIARRQIPNVTISY